MPASTVLSTRPHLSQVLAPQRIAIVGASRNPRSLSARYLDPLIRHEYPGEIIPINLAADEVRGIPAVPSLEDVQGPIGSSWMSQRGGSCGSATSVSICTAQPGQK